MDEKVMARRRKGTNFTLVFAHTKITTRQKSTLLPTQSNVNINFNIFYNIHGYRAITIDSLTCLCVMLLMKPQENLLKARELNF